MVQRTAPKYSDIPTTLQRILLQLLHKPQDNIPYFPHIVRKHSRLHNKNCIKICKTTAELLTYAEHCKKHNAKMKYKIRSTTISNM